MALIKYDRRIRGLEYESTTKGTIAILSGFKSVAQRSQKYICAIAIVCRLKKFTFSLCHSLSGSAKI